MALVFKRNPNYKNPPVAANNYPIKNVLITDDFYHYWCYRVHEFFQTQRVKGYCHNNTNLHPRYYYIYRPGHRVTRELTTGHS